MKIILYAALSATMFAAEPAVAHEGGYATTPRAAWAEADPADSLYRAGKRALNNRDYETAARIFDRIATSYPKSEYAPDALYWKGFALYRNGDLDDAVAALELQGRKYPGAATRSDASALLIQLKGQLAMRGDSTARRDVDRAAGASARSCADIDTQVAALDALQQMDSERVLPLLRKVMARRDECSLPLRKNALFILAQKGGADREKMLLDVAKNDPNSSVRSDAVFHLSQGKSDATLNALEDLLLHSDEKTVRSNALFALAQQKSDRARRIIRDFALSDDAPVALRNDAIFQLAQGNNPADVEWLATAYTKVTDAGVRKNIMFHIASRQGPETTKWLTSVVADPKEAMDMRKDALFHLATRKGTTEDLIAVYDRLAPPMRKEMLFHISNRHDAASLDKLISIAKSDPTPEIRKDALFYVGQSKDPKALKALEDIVAP